MQSEDGRPLDDVQMAFRDFIKVPELQIWVVASIVSIAMFNYLGISVTKKLSGASRATIDACRTILVWTFSVYVGWEHFYGLQVLGFSILLAGTALYNELMASCLAPLPVKYVVATVFAHMYSFEKSNLRMCCRARTFDIDLCLEQEVCSSV